MNTASDHATSRPARSRIRPANAVAALTVLLAMTAMAAIFSTGWSSWLKTVVAISALTYAVAEVMRLLRPPWRSVMIDEHELIVENKQRQPIRIELRSAPFLSPIFIGIRGRIKGTRRPVRIGLFRGQLADQDFRRLSVGLRDSHQKDLQE